MQRSNRLEENVMRNLEKMREQREITEFIRERRREDTEKQLKEMKELCKVCVGERPGVLDPGKQTPRELGIGNIKERCAALEEHLDTNAATLRKHREELDAVHAARRKKRALLGFEPDAPAAGEEPRAGTGAPPAAGPATAWGDTTRPPSGRSVRTRTPGAGSPRSNLGRRSSSGTPALSARQRPGSAGFGATCRLATPREGTPASGLWSWAGARPPSAGSLRARCSALEHTLKSNQKKLESNKLELSVVVKLREEGRQRILESLQEPFSLFPDEEAVPE